MDYLDKYLNNIDNNDNFDYIQKILIDDKKTEEIDYIFNYCKSNVEILILYI